MELRFAILLLLFSAVLRTSAQPASLACVSSIGIEQDGKEANVAVGDTIAIRLAAQLGTGFIWRLEPGDTKVAVPPLGASFDLPAPNKPGGPETMVFRFRIAMPGDATLRFNYVRPWEKKSPAKTFHITLHALASCSKPS